MDRQIKELEIALRKAVHKYDDAWKERFRTKGKLPEPELRFYARCLHEEGYRKFSDIKAQMECWQEYYEELYQIAKATIRTDVAREIFAELKTVMMDEYRYPIIAELKKEYGVMEDEPAD